MNSLLQSRIIWLITILIVFPVLAGCTPDASAQIISPQLGEQLIALAEGGEIVIEPTPEPPKLADLTTEEIYAGVPEELAVAIQSANPEDGPNVALVNACIGCHALEEGGSITGPTWIGLGDRSVARAMQTGSPGPAEYIHSSIVNPNAYIVDGFTAGVMPQNYGETLSQDDMATLIAYILSRQGEQP